MSIFNHLFTVSGYIVLAPSNVSTDLCSREKLEVNTERIPMKSQVDIERANDIANTSQDHQIEFSELGGNISSEVDIDTPLCHTIQIQDDSLTTVKNISQCEPNYMVSEQNNVYNATTNSDPLIANTYSTSNTLFLNNGSHSIKECAQNIGSDNYLTPRFPKMDINKQECKMKTVIMEKINGEKKKGLCKERKASNDYSSSQSNDGKISDSTKLNLDICPVCGDNATKYVHYNGRSCQSCRAFFRRSSNKFSRSVI